MLCRIRPPEYAARQGRTAACGEDADLRPGDGLRRLRGPQRDVAHLARLLKPRARHRHRHPAADPLEGFRGARKQLPLHGRAGLRRLPRRRPLPGCAPERAVVEHCLPSRGQGLLEAAGRVHRHVHARRDARAHGAAAAGDCPMGRRLPAPLPGLLPGRDVGGALQPGGHRGLGVRLSADAVSLGGLPVPSDSGWGRLRGRRAGALLPLGCDLPAETGGISVGPDLGLRVRLHVRVVLRPRVGQRHEEVARLVRHVRARPGLRLLVGRPLHREDLRRLAESRRVVGHHRRAGVRGCGVLVLSVLRQRTAGRRRARSGRPPHHAALGILQQAGGRGPV
mmetsp:Transcript_97657/g.273256  ORF Transcript_97657/g.273256 Transcript_97657/m.273256 type:complete len:337 (-) Transcript_97657:1007-2017(-)